MPKNQDWLDLIEESTQLKKGTKIPKGMDVYSLTMLMYPSPNMQRQNNPMVQSNGNMGQSFNTGAGSDGIVQPNKPVALDTATNPASVYHEGETIKPFPGGKQIIPATTESQQQQLAATQQQMNLPGYATGGTVYDSTTLDDTNRPTNIYSPTTESNMYQSGVNQAFKTTQNRAAGTDPLMANITNRALTAYDTRAAVSDTATRQSLASNPYLTEGAKNAVTAKERATYSAGLSDLTGGLAEQSMSRAEAANTQLYNMGQTGLQSELAKEQWAKSFGEQQYQSDVSANQWQKQFQTNKEQWDKSFDFEKQKYGDDAFTRMANDAQTTSLATWLQKYPGSTEADYNTAREYKNLQLGAMEIANQTASETLTQLKDSAQWNEAQQFLNAGDYANYSALVKQITGKNIDTATFQADRKYLETMRGLETEAATIANDAARFNLTNATMEAVINDINNGVPLNTINATYNPQPPLTAADYSSMSTKYKQAIQGTNLALQSQSIANDAALLGISTDRMTSFVNAINSGADLAAANQASGLNLTQAQMDSISTKYKQGLKATELQLTNAQMQNEATAMGISADRLNVFINAVNNGADLNAANAASGLSLNQTQMNSIAAKYKQELQAGALQLTSQQIANEAANLGISADRLNTFVNAVNSGADLNAANAASGLSLTQTQMDSIATQYKQAIKATALQLTNAEIANEAAALGVSADRLNTFVNAVNSGADLNAANSASGLNLTQAQMNSIAAKYQQELKASALQLTNAEIANEAAVLGVSADRLNVFINAVNNGADLAAANSSSGLNLTQTQMNSISAKYQQELKAGNLQLTNAEMQNEATALGISVDRLNAFINAVNNGADLSAANGVSGLNLTQAQMNSIATKYQLAIKATTVQLTNAELANEAAALGISADRLSTFINAINNGSDLAAANAASGLNLSQTQMNLIAAKYQQELQANALQLTKSQLANEAAALGISADRLATFINAINSGSDLNAANAASGLSLNQAQMDSIATKYRQEIKAGQLQLTNAEIANEAAALGVSTDRLNSFISAVNNGSDLAAANAASGLNLTQAQMDSIATKYRQTIKIGDLSVDAAELANDAAKLGINADKLSAFINAANSGADLAAANAASGLNLSQAQMDSITTKYRMGIEEAQLALAQTKNAMGDAMYASIVNMINSGSSLKTVNDKLAEQGKSPITSEEFQGMLNASALGERNWGRELSAANMLLATPGIENKIEAEKAFGNLFPNVEFNFENLAQQEQAELFTDALSQMAGYVAAGLNYNDASSLIKKSNLGETLGLSNTEITSLYHAMEVNAVDSEWDEMENSDFYAGLSETEQNDLQEFFKQKMLGQLDYTAMHEYEIYNPDGTVHMTLYSKDSTEADKKAAALGNGYTVNDTGRVKFQVASTVTSPTQPTTTTGNTPTNEAWAAFQDTQLDLPTNQQVTYNQWVKSGKPATYDEYKASETPIGKLDNLEVTSSKQLLDSSANTKLLYEAYKDNASDFKNSDYFFTIPSKSYLEANMSRTTSGANKTTMTSALKNQLEENYGKLMEYNDGKGNVIVGQLTEAYTTPNTVQLKIKKEDGSYITFSLLEQSKILSTAKPTTTTTKTTPPTSPTPNMTGTSYNNFDLGSVLNGSLGSNMIV